MIKAQAPQLALVVGRRLDADQALDAGTVVLGGDVELADTVLRAAQGVRLAASSHEAACTARGTAPNRYL